MACYSNDCKRRSTKCVMIVGAILVVFGIVTAIVGFGLSGNPELEKIFESEWFKKTGLEKIDIAGTLSTVIIGCGVLALVTGIFGCLTGKFKKPFFQIPFCLLAFIIGFVLTIVGFIALAAVANIE